ncbi:hypothetical protein ITJ55_15535 [Frigoribacterium sp. VKM Ac-1396]|uniref:hypothetical protein n=1 Tax=Frigoribacterium sp. VKM Ac-1396 TaxID=2783821 RepID=UPI00188C8B63|nr:hypothetical protein [Frigoribacterium sp. VKM Ac-1396]MBF4602218.1 hypothetical protein [Frigoribacterium sp. VKM Ac-1396]
MAELSASEYARHHDISTRRAQAAAAAGQLDARWVGGRWLIDDAVPHRHVPGRPLSRRSADALVARLSDTPDWAVGLSPSERGRTIARVDELRRGTKPSERLALWLRTAYPLPLGFEAPADDLPDLRLDDRLTPGGSSDDRSGMSVGGRLEAHVSAVDLDALIHEYLLVPSRRPNVLLRVHDEDAPRPLTLGGLIADLATSDGPRERAAADALVREGAR